MVAPQGRLTPAGEQETPLGRICSREIKQRIFSHAVYQMVNTVQSDHVQSMVLLVEQTPQSLCSIILSCINWSTVLC